MHAISIITKQKNYVHFKFRSQNRDAYILRQASSGGVVNFSLTVVIDEVEFAVGNTSRTSVEVVPQRGLYEN
jgi:hypothetical protein